MEIRTGNPFRGREKEKLVSFLKEQDLEYDENITYSMVLEEDGEIIGTASSHNNVIKCVAISKEHQGENLLSTIFSHLVTHMFEQGIYHYFGFTKPKNKRLFEGVGLYPVAETDHVLLLENERDGIKKYMKKLQEETKMTEEWRTRSQMRSERSLRIVIHLQKGTDILWNMQRQDVDISIYLFYQKNKNLFHPMQDFIWFLKG